MKAYERVNVEVVRFEAQDVITASVAAPECICRSFSVNHMVRGRGDKHWNSVTGEECPATVHDDPIF